MIISKVLAGRYGANDLVVLTVNVDRQRPAADAFLKQVRSTLPVVWDSKGDIAKAWKVNDMPTSLVFDRDGKMRFRHQGFFPNKAAEYEGHVAQLVGGYDTENKHAGQAGARFTPIPATRQAEAVKYLNRLSDLLFVLARVLNRANLDGLGGDDVYWRSERLRREAGEGG